ncbi:MAG: DUF222 domain-containing protein, partial [Rubricoccaceae bacterium]|nr:DUF222 domain-containing protein [Rubricoccaceae bacterium]
MKQIAPGSTPIITPLGEQITELVAHLDAAQYQLMVLLEEFDRNEEWGDRGINSCAHWLNVHCGMSTCAARERVRVARALPELPLISRSFSEGQVSYSKVRAMTRVATPENEDLLLNTALHGTASQLEKQVRYYRRYKRLTKLAEDNLSFSQRKVNLFMDEDDSWI